MSWEYIIRTVLILNKTWQAINMGRQINSICWGLLILWKLKSGYCHKYISFTALFPRFTMYRGARHIHCRHCSFVYNTFQVCLTNPVLPQLAKTIGLSYSMPFKSARCAYGCASPNFRACIAMGNYAKNMSSRAARSKSSCLSPVKVTSNPVMFWTSICHGATR